MADLTEKDLIWLLLIAKKFGVKLSYQAKRKDKVLWRHSFCIDGLNGSSSSIKAWNTRCIFSNDLIHLVNTRRAFWLQIRASCGYYLFHWLVVLELVVVLCNNGDCFTKLNNGRVEIPIIKVSLSSLLSNGNSDMNE